MSYPIIWYTSEIESEEHKIWYEVLREKCHYNVVVLADAANLIDMVKRMNGYRGNSCVLIVSGANKKQLMQQLDIDEHKGIQKAIIFCQDTQPHQKWTKKYKKLANGDDVVNEFGKVLEILE